MKPFLDRLIAAALACCAAGPAQGEIKDYEVRRYLYLKTSCGKSSIVNVERRDGAIEFHADCQNKTDFPDGAVVICSDPESDLSCSLKNPGANFHSLKLLQGDTSKAPSP
ncbi:MAG: hypothetical protein JNL45_08160 [Hyphomicrobium sp.]|jgi:hypothetical protein|nr:hypothetical protein [Hyphomicrobium sp.]